MYSKLYGSLRLLVGPGGPDIRRNLRDLGRTEWLARAQLDAIQWKKAAQLLAYAYDNVPYYREQLQREGIHPHDVRDWDDFRAIPFLTREVIKTHAEAIIDPAYRGRLRPSSTSGTTGTPMRFFVPPALLWWSAALVIRSRRWYGVRLGDKMAWFWANRAHMPGEHWTWKEWLASHLRRHRFFNAFAISEASMHAFAQMLTRWQPHMFRVAPSILSFFTHYARDNGFTDIRPRLIETHGERLSDFQRDLFQDFYGCPVATVYSSLETHEIAYECPDGGLHILETRLVELVDDEGRPVPPGQVGQVVVTAFDQPGMPFIRYKNGDLGVFAPEPCSCGRAMPVLQEIVGRVVDFTLTEKGDYVFATFFAKIFEPGPGVVRYQVNQPDREHLEVRLQCKEPPDPAWLEGARGRVQDHFGESVQVTVSVVDRIDASPSGKFRFIRSQVEPEYLKE